MTIESTPLVSVLLPVYNAGKYIHEALESIIGQTYSDFELVVVDDGSTDESVKVVEAYSEKDARIRLITNRHDFIDSLNLGLSVCRGKYVARMDADDKMKPHRLAEQIAVMESHPEIAFCSSYMQHMGADVVYKSDLYGKIEQLAITLLLGNFISHPTVMLRREFLFSNELGYRKGYNYAEDYKLWVDIALVGGQLYVVPEPLIEYRISEEQTSAIYHEEQYDVALKIRNELLQVLLNRKELCWSSELLDLYRVLSHINEQSLLSPEEIFTIFYWVLMRKESTE